MIKLDFSKEFQELKDFYSCGKCKTIDIPIPIVLRTCRHIFCTKCLVIQRKQHCPQCNVLYTALDINRDNKLATSALQTIRNIEKAFPAFANHESNARYTLEYDPEQPCSSVEELILQMEPLLNRAVSDDKTPTQIIDDDEENVDIQLGPMTCKRKSKDDLTCESKKLKPASSTASNIQRGNSKWMLIDQELKDVKLCKEQLKRNAKGETPLHLACKRRNNEVVKQLIDSGMDVNCVDWANWTPLHEAIQSGDKQCTRLLLDAGCLVNVPAANYTTPLHQAAAANCRSLIGLLLNHGADPDVADLFGQTPSDYCKDLHQIEVTPVKASKVLVFNCDSSKCGPKITSRVVMQLLKALTVTNGMEYLIVKSTQDKELFRPKVMAALLKAVPIMKETDLPSFFQCTNMAFLQFIPEALQFGFKRSLRNRLHRLPRFLDGMNIHLPSQTGYQVRGVTFTREQMQGLIEIAGGTILKRAPTESTVEGVRVRPFHARASSALRECAHFIIYDDMSPPLLMYNMRELRHVSARWLLECIWDFEIKWL